MGNKKLKRTERGWGGHYICAHRCLFRRNTLLQYGKVSIVVSTVGLQRNFKGFGYDTVGPGRYFETMAFHTKKEDARFNDADVTRQIVFESDWCIDKIDADDEANDMHETAVDEISDKLKKGFKFKD